MNHSLAMSSYQTQASSPAMIRNAFGQMFNKATSRAKWRRVTAWLNGRSTKLQSLNTISQINKNKLPTVQQVALDDIIGSEGRCQDFDNHFLPVKKHNYDRWINIAFAHHQGVTLPPVQLIHTDAGYFVRDGHHRISVARTYGQAMIEAIVI